MTKLKFIKKYVSPASMTWGTSYTDPCILEDGKVYDVESTDVHTWHTRIKLVGIDGVFNSVWFKEAK